MSAWLFWIIFFYYQVLYYAFTWQKCFLFLGISCLNPRIASIFLGSMIMGHNFKYLDQPILVEVIVGIYLLYTGWVGEETSKVQQISEVQQTKVTYNILHQTQIILVAPIQQMIGPLKKDGTPDRRYKVNW